MFAGVGCDGVTASGAVVDTAVGMSVAEGTVLGGTELAIGVYTVAACGAATQPFSTRITNAATASLVRASRNKLMGR